MEQYEPHAQDYCIVRMMRKVHEQLQTSNANSIECLLLEEKIIYSAILHFERQQQTPALQNQKTDLCSFITSFVQRINKISMESYQKSIDSSEKEEEKLINKSISLLMLPAISNYITDTSVLAKLKIINFNNLSCLYKKHRKYGIALRSINYALQLEEQLLSGEGGKYDIVPTYLNKAAIYSDMKKHRESLEIVLKAKGHIERIEAELIRQIEEAKDPSDKERLIEKRYYGLYMKMIIFYNMGAQKQHMCVHREALEYYKQSKQVATIIGNKLMIDKLVSIIEALSSR